ncbi:uncharacterized protein LOC125043997 [Penaeus chinensis]|uniref:uncharacterized protein LOC125043997 n=1 Tax=Penaeus chinensis TaxID=139456 RepID=UPI001FB68BA3|nr:uncharacterized protein LOC125043997 [Penaeus chinensis]
MWAALVLVMAASVPVTPYSFRGLDPSEVLFENLETEELDTLLDSAIENLQRDIIAIYEDQLRLHHRNVRNLHRGRRSTEDLASPYLDQEYWHSYYYDLDVNNRQMLTVDNITAQMDPGSLNISDVFAVNVRGMPFIYRSDSGKGYAIGAEKMEPLYLTNNWTNSRTGCHCDVDGSMNCACCRPGGCQCRQSEGHSGSACVKCGKKSQNPKCIKAEPEHLFVDAAVGFEHYNYYFDMEEGLVNNVVIAHGNTVSLYRVGFDSLEKMNEMVSLSSVSLAENVKDLGYGEVYLNHGGRHEKLRFLVVFCEHSELHKVFMITFHNTEPFLGLSTTWSSEGTEMQSWQSGTRFMLGVLNGTSIHIHELVVSDIYDQAIRHVQELRFEEEIISWKSYRAGAWDYLLLASRNLVRVFVQLGTYYEPLQDLLPAAGMTHFEGIVPVIIPPFQGKFLLLAGSGSRAVAYAFKGPQHARGEVYAALRQQLDTVFAGDVGVVIKDWDLGSLYSQNSSMVVLPGESGLVRVSLDLKLVDVADPVKLQTLEMQRTIDELEALHKNQAFIMDLAEDRLAHSVEGQTEISGEITIRDINVDIKLETSTMSSTTITIHHQDANGTSREQMYDDYIQEIADVENRLIDLDSQLKTLNNTLDDAVSIHGSERLVEGSKTVVQGGLSVDILLAHEATLHDTVDVSGEHYPLTQTLLSIIRVNDSRKISGKKTFTSGLNVTHLNAGFLDDILVDDILTTSGTQQVSGTVIMNTLRAHNITLPDGGTVGGIDLSEELVLLDRDAILDQCIFGSGAVVRGNVEMLSGIVSDTNITHLFEDSLRVSGGGSVSGTLLFSGVLSVEQLEAGAIMGVNTSEFMSSTVFVNKPATLEGVLSVPLQVTVENDLLIRGLVNGEPFPGNDFLLKTTNTTLNFGSKRFHNVSFGTVSLLPGAKVEGLDTSSLVTLDTPQDITGRKVFSRGIEVLGDLDIDMKRIDGVNLDELNASLSSSSYLEDLMIDLVFEQPVQVPALSYGENFNGLDLLEIADDVVYDDEPLAVLSGLKLFTGGELEIASADFESTFNGHKFEDIVTTSSASTITGKTTFEDHVTFNSIQVNGMVDGVNLDHFVNSSLYLDKSRQLVTGKKTFTDLLFTEELNVTGKVSGVDFTRVFTKAGNQTFTAPQSFNYATFSDVETHQIDLLEGFTVNGIDISELNDIRVSLKNHTEHFGELTVNNTVSVSSSFVAGMINGYNIWSLKEDIVTDIGSSEIFSDLIFNDLHVLGPVTTEDKVGANGLNISDIDRNAVSLASNNTMTGSATWSDLDLQGDITVEGLVNNWNLQALSNNTVFRYTDTSQNITDTKTFTNGFHVNGNINAETTNGVDLSTKLLTLHTDQNITGIYTFHNLEAKKNLTLENFNGIQLDDIAAIALKNPGNHSIVNMNFHEEVNVSHLDLKSTLNNLSVDEVLDDAVSLQDLSVVITGKKNFTSNTTFSNINLNNLNDRNFDDFLSHSILRFSPRANFTSDITVNGTVTATSVVSSSIAVKGTIDEIDHRHLLENAVYVNQDYHFNKSILFSGNLSSFGNINVTSLNEADLMTDYLLVSRSQNFTREVTMNNIITSNVSVEGKVNGYYLPDEVLTTMKRIRGQTVTGSMTITTPVEVLKQVHVTGLTGNHENWVDLSEQVVYLNDSAEIQGSLTFSKPLRAANVSSSSSVLGGVDVQELFAKAWYVDAPALITADLSFMAPVQLSDGLVCKVEHAAEGICKLLNDTEAALSRFNALQDMMKTDFAERCPSATQMFTKLENSIFEGDHFVSVREASTPFAHHASTSFTVSDKTYVVMSWEGRCDSTLFEFNSSSEALEPLQTLQESGYAHDWLFIETPEQAFVVMSASDENNSCSQSSTIVFEMKDGKLVTYQELNAGDRLTKTYKKNGDLQLSIYSAARSWVYLFNAETRLFEEIDSVDRQFDVATSLTTQDGVSVLFWSAGGLGSVQVEGFVERVAAVDVARVEDAVLVEQRGHVFLVAAVTQSLTTGDTHHVELYSVDVIKGEVSWHDSVQLSTPASVTALRAGSESSGAAVVLAVQEDRFPVVYTILGERLRQMTELSTPRVRWSLFVNVPGQTFPAVPRHYLLLGQEGNATVLARLEMLGRAVPKHDLTCDLSSLTDLESFSNLDTIRSL